MSDVPDPHRPSPRPDPDDPAAAHPRPGEVRHPRPAGTESRLTRTERRKRDSARNRTGLIVAALVLAIGVAAAVAVVALRNPDSSTQAGAASTSVAAPPTFGASLPIATPSAEVPSGSGTADASGDAQFTDGAGVADILAAAKSAVEIVDSYDYRRVAADRAAGDKVSTGGFRSRYDSSMTGGVATSAPKSKTVQQATVEKTGIAAVSDDGSRADVLAFGRLQVTTAAQPSPQLTAIALGVSLQNDGGVWQIDDMDDLGSTGTFQASPPGTPALTAAVTAGAREVVDLLSYSRSNYTADFNRALDGLTAVLRTQQQTQRNTLLKTMTAGKVDYAGTIRAVGIESASGTSVLLLVCATGYRVGDTGATVASGSERFEVGVDYSRGRWLVSEYLALASL